MARKTKEDYKDVKLDPTQSYFSPDPGLVEGPVHCGLCQTEMEVTRNVNGPRGFAMAMAGSKSLHDVFCCPLRDELWHKQATKLREAARSSFSAKLAAIYTEEAEQVIAERKPTVEKGLWSVFG